MRIVEMFKSIQGESSYAGNPCYFIRTSGCNLRCRWCDTTYAYDGGSEVDTHTIIQVVKNANVDLVEITGGEPLLQPDLPEVVSTLISEGLRVLVETNGSLDIRKIDRRAVRIMDLKPPGSGMTDRMMWSNIEHLDKKDEVKFVISSRQDYLWSRDIISRFCLEKRCNILLSPVYGELDAKDLAQWMLDDGVKARLQLQLHKIIWGSRTRGK